MHYYSDGGTDLIRIDAPENKHRTGADERANGAASRRELGWQDSTQYRLPIVALFSGDYYPVDEATAKQIMAQVDAERAKS